LWTGPLAAFLPDWVRL